MRAVLTSSPGYLTVPVAISAAAGWRPLAVRPGAVGAEVNPITLLLK